ncbi:hypothetical protein [Paenibacillus sp. YAF4_2]|uniref:hypothetical protein n=1 Tax=Paenibacillus sp. YAF4_2 TaxID=3233085 RepID=UPI003F95893F
MREALQKQGLDVEQLTTAKQLASTPIDINGAVPVPFELTLPAGIKLGDLYPHVIRTKNVLVIYWSYDKEKPLLMKQFSNAMKKV